MTILRLVKSLAAVTVLAGLGFAAFATREHWLPVFTPAEPAGLVEPSDEAVAPVTKVIVSEQTQENLGLKAKPLYAQTYWKTITVPGTVVDRPGLSDRGVTAPVTGVVVTIARVPGDAVRPGDVLFTVRVLSESLHLTQTELFQATQDIALAQAQRKRLEGSGGAIPEARLIEVDNQISRLRVTASAARQELLGRGFTPGQIDAVAGGTFVREVAVVAPPRPAADPLAVPSPGPPVAFEVQELDVDLGQQVQAGQTLCTLADHQRLAIEGRAFRDETPLVERSAAEKWPVEVDFREEPTSDWGGVEQTFRIRQVANTIDPLNRTFAFRIPLENQSRVVDDDGRPLTLWRFRPGQPVRLRVRAREVKNVFVLPVDAVVRDGPEAFVFSQNVDTFERKAVRVLLRDRHQVVLANDGSLTPGTYVAQGGAAQLNRMVKAGGAGGVPKGYHVHADGSLHKNGDEEK